MSRRSLIHLTSSTPQRDFSGGNWPRDSTFNLNRRDSEPAHRSLQQGGVNSGSFLLDAAAASPLPTNAHEIHERSAMEHSKHNMFILNERMDMLFPQFVEVLQSRINELEVLETIQDLIQTCAGIQEEVARELRRADDEVIKSRMQSTLWIEQELKTWKLLYALYKDRIILQNDGGDMDCDILGGSEKEVITQLYACNSTLREYQLIVDWLEACYEKRDIPLVATWTDRPVGWENTLFQLRSKSEIAFGKGMDIVKSLDPDAPVREKRPLHALDEEDNMRLSRCIFLGVRQGRIEEAMALCKTCGQTWRAAILEGWRLHEDPNYEPSINVCEKLPMEGNPRRDIWKKCAWQMADSPKYDEYTRAIAGAFCGHLNSLKALLVNSWDDLLWAYLKVQIDIRVESEIRSCCTRPYHQLPEEYWNSKMSMEQIFDELAVHSNAVVRDYASSIIGTIQKYFILDNIGELLQHIKRWLDDNADNHSSRKLTAHTLRFLTHIILFMRQIGRVDKEETADRVIAAYVDVLIDMGDPQLVAFYTSALPTKMQLLLYSKFMETITKREQRIAALEAAIQAGLDVEKITCFTVESIRQRLPTDVEALEKKPIGQITTFDQRKIRCLEWLTFLPPQRGELLWQTNALIRTFLADGKTECMRAAFNVVPTDSISLIINTYGSKENLPCREECSIKEYLSYKVYIVGLDCFDEWSHMYHNKPKEPKTVGPEANFTERIAAEHKEQSYHYEMNRWKMLLNDQSTVARDALFNVLLFPDMGWLVDPDTAKEPMTTNANEIDWENRQVQMEKLRGICIPDVVLLLHKLLHTSADYQNCIRLADEIASESGKLYKVYTKHKLADLLSKLAESSLELLNAKLDPWGYPLAL